MKRDELARALEILKAKKRKRHFRMMISVLSVFTLLITSFSLSGVGITLSSEASDRVGLKKIAGPAGANNTYTISGETAWADLETLIENKTSGTYNVIVDGPIAADRQIKLNSGVTLNLSGTNNGTIYTASNVSQKFNEMIWANGATLNISDVTFSGQLAEFSGKSEGTKCEEKTVADMLERSKVSYTPGVEANDCMETVWNPDIANSENPTINGTALYVNGTHINQIGTEGVWAYSIKSDKSDFTNASLDSKVGEIIVLANKVVNKNTTDAKFFAMSVDGSSAGWESATLSDVASYGRFQWAKTWTTETSGAFSASERSNGKSVLRPNVDGYEGYISSSKEYKTLKIQQQKQGCTVVSAENATIAKLSIGDGNEIEAEVRAHSPLATSGGFAVRVIEKNNNDGRHYPYAANENPVQATSLVDGNYYFLQTNNSGIIKYLDASSTNTWNENVPSEYSGEAVGSADGHSQLWKYTDGVFKNIKTGKVLYFDGTNVSLKSLTEKVSGPFGCDPNWQEGSWKPIENSSIDNIINTNDGGNRGFFIAADKNANINLNTNSYFKDITFTGTGVHVAPIYINGANVNMDGATVQNNNISYPKLGLGAGADAETMWTNGKNMNFAQGGSPTRWGKYRDGVNATAGPKEGATLSTGSAGAFILNGGTLNINGSSSITKNTADAGAIIIKGNGTVNHNSGSIDHNLGFNSGAVYIDNGTYNLNGNNSFVDSNRAWWNGTISAATSNAYVNMGTDGSSPTISNNENLQKGGGVYVASNHVHLANGNITGNTSYMFGGGIYVDKGSTLLLSNTSITQNEADTNLNGQRVDQGFLRYDMGGAGGGIWTCPTDITYYNDQTVYIYDNTANGTAIAPAAGSGANANGDDFYVVSPSGGSVRLFDPPGTWTDVNWIDYENGKRIERPTNVEELKQLDSFARGVSMTNKVGQASNLNITGNKAVLGGGIGSNGKLMFSQNKVSKEVEASLKLRKTWEGIVDADRSNVIVTVNIYDNTKGIANSRLVTSETVTLGDASDDEAGAGTGIVTKDEDTWGFEMALPVIFTSEEDEAMNNGELLSVYEKLGFGENVNEEKNFGKFANNKVNVKNGADLFSVEIIEEITASTGQVVATEKYVVSLGDLVGKLTYSNYNIPSERDEVLTYNPETGAPKDILTTYRRKYEFEVTGGGLTNKKLDRHAKLTINKKDAETETPLDATFQYRAVTKDTETGKYVGNDDNWTEIEKFDSQTGVYVIPELQVNSIYEIKESNPPKGYTGLGNGRIYIQVDANGIISPLNDADANIINGQYEIEAELVTVGETTTYELGTLASEAVVTVGNKKSPAPQFEIVKIDKKANTSDSDVELGGAEFQIWSWDGRAYVDLKDEDKDGHITVQDIDTLLQTTFGDKYKDTKYYVIETKAPQGHDKLETAIPFKYINDSLVAITENELTSAPDPIKSIANRKWIFKTSSEWKAPTNPNVRSDNHTVDWELVDSMVTVNASANEGVTFQFTVQNEKAPELELFKQDENGNKLIGATWELWTWDGRAKIDLVDTNEYVDVLDSGTTIRINSTNILNAGTKYYIKEASAPQGYTTLDTVIPIELKDGKIKVIAYDDVKDSIPAAIITPTDGKKWTFKNNDTGWHAQSYPNNRLSNDILDWDLIGSQTVVINRDENRQTLEITAKDKLINNQLEVIKVDADDNDKVLPGAIFHIYKVKYEDSQYKIESDEGTLTESNPGGYHRVTNLEKGFYKIRENEAPQGYSKLLNKEILIEVNEKGEIAVRGLLEGNELNEITGDSPVIVSSFVKDDSTGQIKLSLKVKNQLVTYILPETGGQGTWTCTIVGSLMILIGALLLGKKYFLSEVKG